MKRTNAVIVTVVLGGSLLLPACGLMPEDPCRYLDRPGQTEVAEYRQGRELETDVRVDGGWVECEWTGSRWSQDRD